MPCAGIDHEHPPGLPPALLYTGYSVAKRVSARSRAEPAQSWVRMMYWDLNCNLSVYSL